MTTIRPQWSATSFIISWVWSAAESAELDMTSPPVR